eukprot:7848973-Pyramimonas_sp.AAC.1
MAIRRFCRPPQQSIKRTTRRRAPEPRAVPHGPTRPPRAAGGHCSTPGARAPPRRGSGSSRTPPRRPGRAPRSAGTGAGPRLLRP